MKASAKVTWIEKNHLEGVTKKGIKLQIDSVSADEIPKGPTPKELVLHSLAGCTLLDIIPIILKSRKHIEKCWVDVEAEVRDEHPKYYTKIHLTFNFISSDLDGKTAERAIQLSRDKYCSVTAMLRKSVEITSSYNIEKPSKF